MVRYVGGGVPGAGVPGGVCWVLAFPKAVLRSFSAFNADARTFEELSAVLQAAWTCDEAVLHFASAAVSFVCWTLLSVLAVFSNAVVVASGLPVDFERAAHALSSSSPFFLIAATASPRAATAALSGADGFADTLS